MSGITTMLGGGTGPRRHQRHHLHARPWHIARMIRRPTRFR